MGRKHHFSQQENLRKTLATAESDCKAIFLAREIFNSYTGGIREVAGKKKLKKEKEKASEFRI